MSHSSFSCLTVAPSFSLSWVSRRGERRQAVWLVPRRKTPLPSHCSSQLYTPLSRGQNWTRKREREERDQDNHLHTPFPMISLVHRCYSTVARESRDRTEFFVLTHCSKVFLPTCCFACLNDFFNRNHSQDIVKCFLSNEFAVSRKNRELLRYGERGIGRELRRLSF